MKNLWAPWRLEYVQSRQAAEEGCLFCHLLSDSPENDRQNLILLRRRFNSIVLNRYPYASGHLMVVTNGHLGSLGDATPEILHETIELARDCEAIMLQVYRPDGFNIGFNLGSSAGAGISEHLHLHLVPRWSGDSNFLAVIGETRVIPETLETTYDRLLPLFQIAEIAKTQCSPNELR